MAMVLCDKHSKRTKIEKELSGKLQEKNIEACFAATQIVATKRKKKSCLELSYYKIAMR